MPVTAVLSPDELVDAPRAYLAYATRLVPAECAAWLKAFLTRPDWRAFFSDWVTAAGIAGYQAHGAAVVEMAELADAIADALEERALDASVHDGLGQLNLSERTLLPASSPARARIVRWIAHTGGAADAAAMVLARARPRTERGGTAHRDRAHAARARLFGATTGRAGRARDQADPHHGRALAVASRARPAHLRSERAARGQPHRHRLRGDGQAW